MYKKVIIFAIIAALAFTGCEKDNSNDEPVQNPSTSLFDVEKGIVSYSKTKWMNGVPITNKITLIFDEYGKKFREEFEGGSALIVDGTTRKAYTLMGSTKTYVELTPFETYVGLLSQFLYLGDDDNSAQSMFPGFSKKPDKPIVGKKCSVVSWSINGVTVVRGGWKHILFWDQYYEGFPEADESVTFEATVL